MPAVSKVQQQAMAIAKHNPSALYKRNRGLLKMSKEKLHEFASTKRKDLPKRKNSLLSLVDGDAKVARKIAKSRGGKK